MGFKVGDRVEVVDAEHSAGKLVLGDVYTVSTANFMGDRVELDGVPSFSGWYERRFKLVKQDNPEGVWVTYSENYGNRLFDGVYRDEVTALRAALDSGYLKVMFAELK